MAIVLTVVAFLVDAGRFPGVLTNIKMHIKFKATGIADEHQPQGRYVWATRKPIFLRYSAVRPSYS
jgi:hypothetical protein